MVDDPRVFLSWNRINLDRQGREELADEELRSWRRKHEIEAESANRGVETGEQLVAYIITSFAYERSRNSAPEPLSASIPAPIEEGMFKRLTARRQPGRGGSIEKAVSFSLRHRIRIEIRAALHEGPATASRLAEILREELSTVDYHLKEMYKDGSIDIVKTVKVGNLDQHYYSVVTLPYFTDEELGAMSRADRQTLCAVTVQAAIAEAMASLWAGKMVDDPRVFLGWNRVNLDKQGRGALADEEAESWSRKLEIEAKSATRRTKTREPEITYVITSLSYERSRNAAPTPLSKSHLTVNRN